MELCIEKLCKSFRGVVVLDNINCTFSSGKIYGLIGKNGSGKTMLLREIAGLIRPTSGRVLVDGRELHKDISFPPSMGLIIEKPEFLGDMSGFQNLKMLAEIRKTITDEEIKDWMCRFSLDPDAKLPMRKYSLGMKQKIAMIQAVMENPDLLILDEPFNAIDESSVQMCWSLLKELRQAGKLIIITSHHREDIEGLCDETLLIENGMLRSRT